MRKLLQALILIATLGVLLYSCSGAAAIPMGTVTVNLQGLNGPPGANGRDGIGLPGPIGPIGPIGPPGKDATPVIVPEDNSLATWPSQVTGTELPPMRICLYYSGYVDLNGNRGGSYAAASNIVWSAAHDTTNSGLQCYGEIVIERDDGWSTWRDSTGKLMHGTNILYGSDPEFGSRDLTTNIHAMDPRLLVGEFYEITPSGVTSDGWVATDPAHIRQDATNAAVNGIDYVKLDSGDTTWPFAQRVGYVAEFSYWYKRTAAALGHRAILKVDCAGPEWGSPAWDGAGALLLSSIADVWNPCLETTGSNLSQALYERFQHKFDAYFLPYYKLTVRPGHYMEMEGVTFGQCSASCGLTDSSQLNAGQSTVAFLAMFNSGLHFGAVNSPDYAFYQTNTALLALNRNVTQHAILAYQDTLVSPTVQVWRRDLGNGQSALWFWNRQYSLPVTLTLTAAQLGLANTAHENAEVFYGTNYLWSGQLTVNLGPAQSHLVICK